MDIQTALKEALQIQGAIGACLVDYESGMALGTLGDEKALNLEVAAAGNTEVVRAKMRTMESLGLDDSIEDILITLGTQYHLIRPLSTVKDASLFIYLALDRKQANLAMARLGLKRIEGEITI